MNRERSVAEIAPDIHNGQGKIAPFDRNVVAGFGGIIGISEERENFCQIQEVLMRIEAKLHEVNIEDVVRNDDLVVQN